MAEKTEDKKEIDIFLNAYVPKHEIISGEDKAELLEKLNISQKQLPKIKEDDAAVKQLNAKKGDVIKITRKSPVAGIYLYYRLVV